MLAIIDYGVGNLFSLQCSLKKIGVDAVIVSDSHLYYEVGDTVVAAHYATTKITE